MIVFACLCFLIYYNILAQEQLFLQGFFQIFNNFSYPPEKSAYFCNSGIVKPR